MRSSGSRFLPPFYLARFHFCHSTTCRELLFWMREQPGVLTFLIPDLPTRPESRLSISETNPVLIGEWGPKSVDTSPPQQRYCGAEVRLMAILPEIMSVGTHWSGPGSDFG